MMKKTIQVVVFSALVLYAVSLSAAEPTAQDLVKEAGTGQRQGFPDAGPARR